MPILEDKVAIITGASSGLGAATARLFAAEGCAVVLGARRRGELEEVAGEIERAGGRAAVLAGDVQEEGYARALVDLAKDRFGGLDIAFNNAGMIGPMAPAPSLSLADWNTVLATNLTSGFLGAKYQIPAMEERGGGSVIFTSTIVGQSVGLPGMAAYGASKAGLVGLTRVLAAEFGAKGIRVNAILPGGIDTPMGREAASTPEALAFVESLHALKRISSPQEVAGTALYLASPASSFTTGTAMLVDGGVSINRT